jgi:hypothetical protein
MVARLARGAGANLADRMKAKKLVSLEGPSLGFYKETLNVTL